MQRALSSCLVPLYVCVSSEYNIITRNCAAHTQCAMFTVQLLRNVRACMCLCAVLRCMLMRSNCFRGFPRMLVAVQIIVSLIERASQPASHRNRTVKSQHDIRFYRVSINHPTLRIATNPYFHRNLMSFRIQTLNV